jgi:4-azaleucine resistance transporter AzlC
MYVGVADAQRLAHAFVICPSSDPAITFIATALSFFVNNIQRDRRRAFFEGARQTAPSIVGLIPFGLIVGTASTAAGMDPWLALLMSVLVYAGASQLAAIGLMTQGAPFVIVIATVLVVNLRFTMYSATLAPLFRDLSLRRRWLIGYGLTDHLFALVNARFNNGAPAKNVDAFYAGGAIPTWLAWQSTVAIGIFAGTLVPRNWSLDFAIPLVFLALVFPALATRTHWVTAGVACVAAAFTAALPMKLGLLSAALTAVAVGTLLDLRREKRAPRHASTADAETLK